MNTGGGHSSLIIHHSSFASSFILAPRELASLAPYRHRGSYWSGEDFADQSAGEAVPWDESARGRGESVPRRLLQRQARRRVPHGVVLPPGAFRSAAAVRAARPVHGAD